MIASLKRAAAAARARLPAWRAWFSVRVAGRSMAPTLLPGDLLAVRPLRPDEPRDGQIVVARARGREVVKRAVPAPDARALGDGDLWLEGDNPASTDSRTTGPVPRSDVVGVVRARYWPPWRARAF